MIRAAALALALLVLAVPPAAAGFIQQKNIVYDRVTERDADGVLRTENLLLDLYRPKTGRAPLLLYIHGGCYTGGSRSRIPTFLKNLANEGVAVASIDYRLAADPRNPATAAQRWLFPAALKDVQQALRFLRRNSDLYLIDATRVAVHGESAGGHLAAALGVRPATDRQDRSDRYSARVDIVSNWYGRTDFTLPNSPGGAPCHEYWLGMPQNATNGPAFEKAGILPYVDGKSASRFQIMHGSRDPQVDPIHSVLLAQRLRAAGIEARLYLNEGWPHGFSGSLLAEAVTRRFLVEALGTAPAAPGVLWRLQIDSGRTGATDPAGGLPDRFQTDRHLDPANPGEAMRYARCGGQAVAGTSQAGLYRDVRYGRRFGYRIPVENGIYRLRLHFAECHYTHAGQRRMDVRLFGIPMLRGYDILEATRSALATADVQELHVIVRHRVIDLGFVSVTDNNAIIGAIEVERLH
jgi:acetyl esterase/lipase